MSTNNIESGMTQGAVRGFVHRRMLADHEFKVDVMFDAEASIWLASCAEIGLFTEASTLDALEERAMLSAPEIAVENGRMRSGESVILTFTERALA